MSSEASGVRIIIPPQPSAMNKVVKVKKRQLLEKKQNMDLINSREDLKRRDQRTDHLSHKYAGGNSTVALHGIKSVKEFKPLGLDHNFRSYSVSIIPGTTKHNEKASSNLQK